MERFRSVPCSTFGITGKAPDSPTLPDSRGPTLKAIATTYNRGLHRFAVVLACWTFLLIIAGALVTSNDAGLSVPDWPTSFGSLYKIPKLVGGVKFEHTHRMIAQVAGLMTIILAVWMWRAEKRRWLKILAFAAIGTVIAQGVLGGLTVLFFLPPPISSAHAALAQTFFCLAVAMAVFTGQKWIEEQPRIEFDQRRPSLFTLTLLSIFVLYVQLILGAMFRHHGLSWWPHVAHAVVVSFVLAWTAVRALTAYPNLEAIRRPAITMLSLVIAQLCLGFMAFLTRVSWGHDAVQPELPMVISTVTHVAVGALLLATTVVLAIQTWRHVPVAFEERVGEPQRNPSAA
ncbi:MAG TPA: COX15/CtaA family protein [Candidatus Sulfotelmatobacter sp.]|nr:COX15/CtaA family protein [Candidatus Sulfotelmatobacter sp.]